MLEVSKPGRLNNQSQTTETGLTLRWKTIAHAGTKNPSLIATFTLRLFLLPLLDPLTFTHFSSGQRFCGVSVRRAPAIPLLGPDAAWEPNLFSPSNHNMFQSAKALTMTCFSIGVSSYGVENRGMTCLRCPLDTLMASPLHLYTCPCHW